MKLPFFGKKSKQVETNKDEVFAVVRITPVTVQIALCNVESDGKTYLISSSDFFDWSKKEDNLVSMVDQGLAQVIPFLPDKLEEPNKVLFGIPDLWVENGLPVAEYKELLKQVSKELDLKPIGFAVTSEAVVNLLNKEESATVTALVVTLDKEWVEVSLVFQGKIQQTETGRRTESVVESLKNLLVKFPNSQLPARMVVFNGNESLSKIDQDLNEYDWTSDGSNFAHMPKIDVLVNEVPIKSLVSAAGQVMGKDLKIEGSWTQREIEAKSFEDENGGTFEAEKEDGPEHEVTPPGEDENTDIEEEKKTTDDEEGKAAGESKIVESGGEKLPIEGFVIGEDIKELDSISDSSSVNVNNDKSRGEQVVMRRQTHEAESQSGNGTMKSTNNINMVRGFTNQEVAAENNTMENQDIFSDNLSANDLGDVNQSEEDVTDSVEIKHNQGIKKVKFNKWKFKFPWKWALGLLLIFGAIGGGVYALYANTTAEVTIIVRPEPLENDLTLVVDPSISEVDEEAGRLPGEVLVAENAGAKSIPTTGTKTVGERAKGEVTIYNDTDAVRNLESGTVLTEDGLNLQFTLDDDVQVASKSVDLNDLDSPFKPGVAKSDVTAVKIGAEYNLDANSLFSIANLSQSSILARNESAFSGGSSREIDAVAEADVVKLSDSLSAELESQAVSKLKEQLEEGKELIESSVESEVVDENFNYEVGDEAEVLSLDMDLEFTGVAYSKSDFLDLVSNQLSSRVPLNKELSDVINTNFQLQESEEDVYEFRVVTTSYLLPKLSPDNIKEKIAGKRPAVVKDYLLSLPSVSRIRNEMNPKLPEFLDFLSRFPWSEDRIEVKILAEDV